MYRAVRNTCHSAPSFRATKHSHRACGLMLLYTVLNICAHFCYSRATCDPKAEPYAEGLHVPESVCKVCAAAFIHRQAVDENTPPAYCSCGSAEYFPPGTLQLHMVAQIAYETSWTTRKVCVHSGVTAVCRASLFCPFCAANAAELYFKLHEVRVQIFFCSYVYFTTSGIL